MKIVFLILFSLLGNQAHAAFGNTTRPFSLTGQRIDGLEIVRPQPDESALNKLGIMTGDIVLEVDHMPILNSQAATEAYLVKELQSATVIRKNKKILLEKKK